MKKNNIERLILIIKKILMCPDNTESQDVIEFSEYESEENFTKTNFGESAELSSGVLKSGRTYLYSYENIIPGIEEDAIIKTEDDVIIYMYLLN